MAATARKSRREALLAELLGDLGPLLDRTEALRASLPAADDAAAVRLLKSVETPHLSVKTEYTHMLRELRKLTRKARRAQSLNRQSGKIVNAMIFTAARIAGVLGKTARRWFRPLLLAGAILGATRRGMSSPKQEKTN